MPNIPNSPSTCSKTDITSFNTLIEKIWQDKKIDGKDKIEIEALFNMYEVDKKDCLLQTKTELENILKKSLENWFTVKNKDDIVVLEKILKLIGKSYPLADNYDTLYKFWNFSVRFRENILEFYCGENPINTYKKREWMINEKWEFIFDNSLASIFRIDWNMDLVSDNNRLVPK